MSPAWGRTLPRGVSPIPGFEEVQDKFGNVEQRCVDLPP